MSGLMHTYVGTGEWIIEHSIHTYTPFLYLDSHYPFRLFFRPPFFLRPFCLPSVIYPIEPTLSSRCHLVIYHGVAALRR